MMYVLYERHSFPVYSEDDSGASDTVWEEKVNLILASENPSLLETEKVKLEEKQNKVLEARKAYYQYMNESSPMYPVFLRDSSVSEWWEKRESIREGFEKKSCDFLESLVNETGVPADSILNCSHKKYEMALVPVE